MIGILAVLAIALVGLSRLSSNNTHTGSSCGCGAGSTCPSTPPSAQASDVKSGGGESDNAATTSKSEKGLPRLVDLGSTTCVPCKMMTSVLDDLSSGYKGKLAVEFININEDREAAQQYNIRAIPTQVFIDASGKEIFRHEGYYPKEDILAKFKELGINLGKGK